MKMPELPEKIPFTPEQQARVDKLLRDEWLRKKTNRARRIYEHLDFLNAHVPEILIGPPTRVLDIGPGCGETLEIARAYGHSHLGIDAPSGAGGMGNAYVEYSRLCHEALGLNVAYCGLEGALTYTQQFNTTGLIVSRGSWEQSLSSLMEGEPHDKHHDSSKLSWIESSDTEHKIRVVLEYVKCLLSPGGVFLLHMNGAKNTNYMVDLLLRLAPELSLKPIVNSSDNRLIKFEKLNEDSGDLRHGEADVNGGDDRMGVLEEGESTSGSLPE